MTLPASAAEVLREGVLCYLAAPTRRGPHCTPVVFVEEQGSLWVTTRRGAVKSRAWRLRPEAAALVRQGEEAVTLAGHVTMHDFLDPSTWGGSLAMVRPLARASARFTRKNARFFAGYARDAHRVPLAWTPPARLVVGLHPDGGAVLGAGSVETWGRWERREASVPSAAKYRRTRRPALELPEAVAPEREGIGVIAVEGAEGLVTLPVRYRSLAGTFLCSLPAEQLALAAPEAGSRAALVIDTASSWRASAMRGVMIQGAVETFLPGDVEDGADRLEKDAKSLPGEAVMRLIPERATWWQGWTSGTVGGR